MPPGLLGSEFMEKQRVGKAPVGSLVGKERKGDGKKNPVRSHLEIRREEQDGDGTEGIVG